MYGVFGYARKPMIVKVNSPPRCLGYFGVLTHLCIQYYNVCSINIVKGIHMIHYRENCKCKTVHLPTGICTECAHHNHHAFVLHTKNGTDSADETEQKILTRLRTDPSVKFRIGPKRHASCGHPGVWQGSVCAICAQKRRDERASKPVSAANTEADALRENIAMIEHNISVLNEQLETMKNALLLSESGIHVGIIKIKSPRQQAIADGKRWYIPYEPCKHCNIIAERYVANGKCRNCGR